MAADTARYDLVDSELFSSRQLPAGHGDARSVGELLTHVDHLARQLLLDVGAPDAGALLHGWPLVAAAAGRLWAALPQHPNPHLTPRHVAEIDRIGVTALAIDRRLGRARWPGAQQPDARLRQMAATLDRVTGLVSRYGTEIPRRDDTSRDVQAARAHLMHGMYVTAHAVGVALYDVGRHQYVRTRRAGRYNPDHSASPYAIAPVTEWIHRMGACEALAQRYLGRGFAAAMAGEALAPSENDHRLAQALARWDIEVHRTLAGEAWTPNMVLVARTQGLIAAATSVLLQAERGASHADGARLPSLVEDSARAWNDLATRWGDLTRPDARLSPGLLAAAGEVRAAYRDLTHDNTVMASIDNIAIRPGFADGLKESLRAQDADLEIAHLVAEKAHAPGLKGPARALSIRAHNEAAAGRSPSVEDADIVWVSPADILAKRTILLPEPVAKALMASADRAVRAVEATSQATALVVGQWDDFASGGWTPNSLPCDETDVSRGHPPRIDDSARPRARRTNPPGRC